MNDEKWGDLKEKVSEKFGHFDLDVQNGILEDDLGHKFPQKTEVLEFKSPLGELRIERVSHPKILEKKAHYHKGAGGAKLEFIVDENEYSHKMTISKRDEVTGNWLPLDVPADRLSF